MLTFVKHRGSILFMMALITFLFYIPQLVKGTDTLGVVIDIVTTSTFYLLVSSGLALIFGIMRIMNMAHATFYTMGAYLCWGLYREVGFNFGWIIVISAVAMAVVGYLLYWGLLGRPLTGTVGGRPVGAMLISRGIAYIIAAGLVIGLTALPRGVPSIIPGAAVPGLSNEKFAVSIVSIGLVAMLILFINYTTTGKSMKAITQSREAALMCGINPWKTGAVAFILGTILTGIGGVLMVPILYATPTMGADLQMKAMFVIIVGGIGSMGGTMAAAFIIGITEVITTRLWGVQIGIVSVFVLAMTIFAIKPTGLFGYAMRIL